MKNFVNLFPDISVKEIGFLEQFKALGYLWLCALGWGATRCLGGSDRCRFVILDLVALEWGMFMKT